MDQFEYCTARTIVEDFFWKDFCDNYLELIKVRVYDQNNEDSEGKQSAINSLHFALNTILKLFAPFLPHITEELHDIIYAKGSIHAKHMWPEHHQIKHDINAETLGDHIIEILDLVRKFKTEQQISLRAELNSVNIIPTNQKLNDLFTKNSLTDLKNAANTKNICINEKNPSKTEVVHEISNDNFKLIIKI